MRKAAFALLMASIAAFPPALAAAEKAKSLPSRIKQEESDLGRLKERIRKQEKSISIAGAKESSLLKTLGRIEDQLAVQEKELGVLHLKIEHNKAEIDKLEGRMAEVQNQVKSHNRVMAGRLRAMYKEGPLFGLKALFSSDNMVDLLRRVKYMEALAEFDRALNKE